VCEEEIRKHPRIQSPFSISLATVTVTLVSFASAEETRKDSSQVSVPARKLWLHVRDKFSGEDSFQTAADTLRDCNMVEHSRV
jgi:hypothetical protein